MDAYRLAESFGLHVADLFGDGHVLDGGENAVGDAHLPWTGVRAQPRGQIRDAADGGVVEAALKTDAAQRRKALGNPLSEREIPPLTPPPHGQLVHRVADLQRHAHRTLGGVIVRDRVVEEHHYPVAGEPLEGALVLVNQCAHRPVVFGEYAHHFLGFTGFCERGEVPEIGEQHDYFPAMALEEVLVADDQIGQLR